MASLKEDVAEVKTAVKFLIKSTDEHQKTVMTMLKKHEEIFTGNGDAGMIKTVDRLNQAEKRRIWHFRVLWAGFLGLLGKIFFGE